MNICVTEKEIAYVEHGAVNAEVSTHYVFKILANHKIFTFHIPYSLDILRIKNFHCFMASAFL